MKYTEHFLRVVGRSVYGDKETLAAYFDDEEAKPFTFTKGTKKEFVKELREWADQLELEDDPDFQDTEIDEYQDQNFA